MRDIFVASTLIVAPYKFFFMYRYKFMFRSARSLVSKRHEGKRKKRKEKKFALGSIKQKDIK